jgi:acetyl esterase/lipase
MHARRSHLIALAILSGAPLPFLAACGGGDGDPEAARRDDPMPAPNASMQAVLAELAALDARPVEQLTTEQARMQPTPADAVRSLLARRGLSTAPQPVASVQDATFAGPGGMQTVRVYTPVGTGPFPLLLYIHGGGWVIATVDTYDASARALCNAAGAVVVSAEYRKAPEFPFPAAHEDTWAAWQWMVADAGALNGSAARVAVAGESAGGNMAASIALRARGSGVRAPLHQVLIYPVVDAALDSPSEEQNAAAMPLSTAGLSWFYTRVLRQPGDPSDPRFALLANDLRGVAPATVITADIDPRRSEGRWYAQALAGAGVPVRWENFEGVTHEFFGMGALLQEARDAVSIAAQDLRAAYASVA